jgi:hypothetical protein
MCIDIMLPFSQNYCEVHLRLRLRKRADKRIAEVFISCNLRDYTNVTDGMWMIILMAVVPECMMTVQPIGLHYAFEKNP